MGHKSKQDEMQHQVIPYLITIAIIRSEEQVAVSCKFGVPHRKRLRCILFDKRFKRRLKREKTFYLLIVNSWLSTMQVLNLWGCCFSKCEIFHCGRKFCSSFGDAKLVNWLDFGSYREFNSAADGYGWNGWRAFGIVNRKFPIVPRWERIVHHIHSAGGRLVADLRSLQATLSVALWRLANSLWGKEMIFNLPKGGVLKWSNLMRPRNEFFSGLIESNIGVPIDSYWLRAKSVSDDNDEELLKINQGVEHSH